MAGPREATTSTANRYATEEDQLFYFAHGKMWTEQKKRGMLGVGPNEKLQNKCKLQ